APRQRSYRRRGRGPRSADTGGTGGAGVSMSDATTGSPRGADRTGRPRDAAASKDALLQAARTLFGQQGFEGTTIREIGERAGVDAALIARYFGSKAYLYIAAVVAEDADGPPSEYEGLAQIADA